MKKWVFVHFGKWAGWDAEVEQQADGFQLTIWHPGDGVGPQIDKQMHESSDKAFKHFLELARASGVDGIFKRI